MSDHFVEDTAETPNVTSVVVGLIFPNFGGTVVRCSSLCSEESLLGHFADIQIAKFDDTSLGQEQIGTLNIPVADLQIVKCFQSSNDLNEVVPNLVLR